MITLPKITQAEVEALLSANKSAVTFDKAGYPFWKAPVNTTTLIRLLPNGDKNGDPNPAALPYVEKREITLHFDGLINSDHDTTNGVTAKVPCNQTWGGQCPITESIAPLWKGSAEEREFARRYYRKASFIYQGFVISSAFKEEVPENPIRRFSFSKQVHEVIYAGMMNSDFEDAVYCFTGGRDFKVVKTQQGVWANYSTSQFSYRSRPLNEGELAALDKYKLFHLEDQLGTAPDKATLDMVYAMYQDSVAGRPFDNALYGGKFKAFEDRQFSNAAPAAPMALPPPTPVLDEHTAEVLGKLKGRLKTAHA